MEDNKEKMEIDQELLEQIKRIPVGYSHFRIEFFFWIGVVSAILLRGVKLTADVFPVFSRVGWYVAVIGYCFFFLHRLKVSNKRKSAIKQLDLLNKIKNKEPLNMIDYDALNYVLWSLSVSKEKMNYFIILAFSVVAIVVGLIVDLT